MKMKTLLLIVVTGICMSSLQADELSIAADAASFQYDSNAAFVEIYYEIQESWKTESPGAQWRVNISLDIFRGDSLYTQTNWTDSSPLDSAQQTISISGRAYFLAISGDYTLQLSAQNADNVHIQDRLSLRQSLSPFLPEPIILSDPELATQIDFVSADKKDHPFYKNSLMVTPNPSRVYGVRHPILYYYSEIYSDIDSMQNKNVKFQTEILDNDKKKIESIPASVKTRQITAPSLVEIGQVGLFSLPTGDYYLRLSLLSDHGVMIDQKDKAFYVFTQQTANTAEPAVSNDALYQLSPFVSMEKKELEYEIDTIRYLMKNDEKKISNDLDSDESMRRFLFSFWQKRDPNPVTVPNEFYNDYLARIEQANGRFSSIRRDGWKTDRGRVFMIFGPPADMDRYPVTSERIPYEVWTYEDIEGGVEFVFADRSGYKEYQLIHSTKQGEVYNPQYQDQLLK